MQKEVNPILNRNEGPNLIDHEPKTHEEVIEKVKKKRALAMRARLKRQELYDRYIRWIRRENPMVDAMGRMAMGDVTRQQPDPAMRLKRRHYISQKWQQLRLRNNAF